MGVSAGRRKPLGGHKAGGQGACEEAPHGVGGGNYAESPGKVGKIALY